jgi:hypothetical protein
MPLLAVFPAFGFLSEEAFVILLDVARLALLPLV